MDWLCWPRRLRPKNSRLAGHPLEVRRPKVDAVDPVWVDLVWVDPVWVDPVWVAAGLAEGVASPCRPFRCWKHWTKTRMAS